MLYLVGWGDGIRNFRGKRGIIFPISWVSLYLCQVFGVGRVLKEGIGSGVWYCCWIHPLPALCSSPSLTILSPSLPSPYFYCCRTWSGRHSRNWQQCGSMFAAPSSMCKMATDRVLHMLSTAILQQWGCFLLLQHTPPGIPILERIGLLMEYQVGWWWRKRTMQCSWFMWP